MLSQLCFRGEEISLADRAVFEANKAAWLISARSSLNRIKLFFVILQNHLVEWH